MKTKDNNGTEMTFDIVSLEPVYNGFFKVDKLVLEHDKFQGSSRVGPIVREVLHRGNAAAVIMHDTKTNEVLLIEQFRIGPIGSGNPWQLEIVAGVVEEGEMPAEVARKEALEESGVSIGEMTHITTFYNSSGGSSEKTDVFYSSVDLTASGGVHGLEHEGEDIRSIKIDAGAISQMVQAGTIQNASLIIASMWMQINVLPESVPLTV